MDLQEATTTMAFLMRKEADFYEQHAILNQEISREDLKQIEWLKANTREFGNRLAANPNFFDVMESWTVVIMGSEGVSSDSVQESLKTDDVDDLVDRASSLAASIKAHLRSNGYVICEMSAGEDGWDVVVRCTDKQSKNLCIELLQRYTQAIDLGLLSISRRFAGHMLPGLRNWDDAKRILLIYGDDLPSME
jgi:hypothetical protein